jgi:hypothetical protein
MLSIYNNAHYDSETEQLGKYAIDTPADQLMGTTNGHHCAYNSAEGT